MAVLFLRVLFVCAVILSFYPAKTKSQVANINSVSGVKNIADTHDVTDPEDVVVVKGQPATLRCSIRPPGTAPDEATTITWLHQNRPIQSDDSRRTVLKDGSLHLPRVTAGGKRPLTGAYRCLVKNGVGVVLSGEAKLQIASLEFNATDLPVEVAEEQPILLPCRANSVPTAQIRWEHNKQPLPHYSRYVPLQSGALLILKTHKTDSGVFRCVVTNTLLKKTKIKSVTLTVLPKVERNVPVTFVTEPVNCTVSVGSRHSLYCSARGWPLPKIEWLKSDEVISNTSVLTVIAQSDHVAYVCRAQQTDGNVVVYQRHSVTVERKPYFTKTPTSVSYANAGIVKLACAAGGVPTPCIRWLKNGEPVTLGARTKIRNGTLVMSHTFTADAGIYQCVAANSAGTVWAPAQVILNPSTPPIPPPPRDVTCRSYDRKSVCLTWKEPKNVAAVVAYSVFSFYKTSQECLSDNKCQGSNNTTIGCEDGSHEEPGPDYVITNGTYILADRLNGSTNYTFYVRLYSTGASDDSNWVTCNTVVEGERNLKFRLLGGNSIELVWSQISSDVSCGLTNTSYIVQWKNEVDRMVNSNATETLKYNITGLNPEVQYQIRVMSASYRSDDTNWVLLKLPEHSNGTSSYTSFDERTIALNVPTNPEGFRATSVDSKSVTLNWMAPEEEPEFYVICYSEIGESCEKGTIVRSLNNIKQIEDLKPNTMYEFRIRAHNAEGFHGPFSSPIEVKTHPDVPSTVLDLKYKIINDTTACLAWLPPLFSHGTLLNYVVTYTSNADRPFEEWTYVTVSADATECWSADQTQSTRSVLLKQLALTEAYTVIVRAASADGLSNPTYPFVLRTAYKRRDTTRTGTPPEVITGKQKIGVLVGSILALVCVACCVSCLALRRRCVKRRDLADYRAGTTTVSNDAAAHYAPAVGTVRLGDARAVVAPDETENLVDVQEEEEEDAVPRPVYLDSKGTDEIPNGRVNGLHKPLMNGHLTNGHVHITENPQHIERKEKNGDLAPPLSNGFKKPAHYTLFQGQHDDPNCNRILTTPTKRRNTNKCNGLFNGGGACHPLDEEALPFTGGNDRLETTCCALLDDPFIIGHQRRRISPLMGSNV